MKVLIIEDEAPAFRRLQRILEELRSDIEILDVIDSIQESVKWFNENAEPDLIFMDIQLADGLSFEIFEQVKILTPVIFTTAYDEYTLRAFKVNSVDYLLKPINKELLEESLEKMTTLNNAYSINQQIDLKNILEQVSKKEVRYKSRFLIKVRDQLISLNEKEIAYFYTMDGLIFVKTQHNKKYVVDFSLDELEELLDPKNFYRINRQFIARIESIATCYQYSKGKLKVEFHVEPPISPVIVSREKSSDFKNWLDLY